MAARGFGPTASSFVWKSSHRRQGLLGPKESKGPRGPLALQAPLARQVLRGQRVLKDQRVLRDQRVLKAPLAKTAKMGPLIHQITTTKHKLISCS